MQVRLFSDLHYEFGNSFVPPTLVDEDKMVCVLAGDVGVALYARDFVPLIRQMCKRHRHVLMINGNHEYYHTTFSAVTKTISESVGYIKNFHYGDNFTVVVDNVAFVCATLWTDMNKQNPLTLWSIVNGLNDFRLIKLDGDNRITPEFIINQFNVSKEFVFGEIKKHKCDGRRVFVVTHHGCSWKSVHPRYQGDSLNGGFVSDLSDEILDDQPDIWVHGHVHDSFDYMIGTTRVVVNPYGYHNREVNPSFDPKLVIEI